MTSAVFSFIKSLFAWSHMHHCSPVETHEVCEFDNVRKRMSVILRMPSGEILLYVKGADSSILPHVLEPAAQVKLPETSRNFQKSQIRSRICWEYPETKVQLS